MQNKPQYMDRYFISPFAIRFNFQPPEGFLTDKDVFNSYGLEVLGGYWKAGADPDVGAFKNRVYERIAYNERLTMDIGVNAPIVAAVMTVSSNRTVPQWMKRGIVFFNDIDDLPKAWQKNVASTTGCDAGGIAWKGGKLGELLNDANDLLRSDEFYGIEDITMSPEDVKATGIKAKFGWLSDAKEAKKAMSLRKGWSMRLKVAASDGHFGGEFLKAKGVQITDNNEALIQAFASQYGEFDEQ
jgi:hypothetical protein|nr:MAG TPA: hypothetical protein [Caudoviricetes sp.]